ncbi:hypothetical protein BsWGS_05832 [Bradybaena similaris]
MQRFINMGVIGEGSYGMVFKCMHKVTGQLVAVKKVLEIETDSSVRKIAFREIRMLRLLQHDNLVKLIEVFREFRELFLVFEFVDHTLLDELDRYDKGIEENLCRQFLWQVLKGTQFIHAHNAVHRDIKPENILVSDKGIVKICDFGFARPLALKGEAYTDYVATRWYRAPELLVGDIKYGRAVDIWAIGCLVPEMLTGEPMFPGDSDIDQLYLILECCGRLTTRHKEVFRRNPLFIGMRLPVVHQTVKLKDMFLESSFSAESLLLIKQCLEINPDNRPTCNDLLKHDWFVKDGFDKYFPMELKQLLREKKTPLDSRTTLTSEDINENCQLSLPVKAGILERETIEFERNDKRHVLTENGSKLQHCRKQRNHLSSLNLPTSLSIPNNKTGEGLPACIGSKILNKNKSHSNSSELQPFTNCDSLDLEKDVRYFLSPLLYPLNGSAVNFHTQAKKKDVLEVCGFSRPPPNHYGNTLHLQQKQSEVNSPQSSCMKKPQNKTSSSRDGFREKQPSRILPDVSGANAAAKHYQ